MSAPASTSVETTLRENESNGDNLMCNSLVARGGKAVGLWGSPTYLDVVGVDIVSVRVTCGPLQDHPVLVVCVDMQETPHANLLFGIQNI